MKLDWEVDYVKDWPSHVWASFDGPYVTPAEEYPVYSLHLDSENGGTAPYDIPIGDTLSAEDIADYLEVEGRYRAWQERLHRLTDPIDWAIQQEMAAVLGRLQKSAKARQAADKIEMTR